MMVLSRKITSSFHKFKRHLQNPLRLDRPEPFFDGEVFLQRSSDRRTGNGVCERICDEDIGTGVSYVKRFLSSKNKKSQKQTIHSVSGFSYFCLLFLTKGVQERNVCLCGNDLTAVGKRTALFYSWIFLVLHILTNSGSKCFTAVP